MDRPSMFTYQALYARGMTVVDVPRREAGPSAYGRRARTTGNNAAGRPSVYQARYGRERAGGVRMGMPSIEAVAMAGGTVYGYSDSDDDGTPPAHLLVESLEEEVRPPLTFMQWIKAAVPCIKFWF